MTSLPAVLVLGFLLGLRHATDADHVIAVSTIVSRHRRLSAAALVGAAWGAGHTLTLLAVGGGMVLFGWVIPEKLDLSFEFGVAMMLIVLGLANLRNVRDVVRGVLPTDAPGAKDPPRVHRHGDYVHSHPRDDDAVRHPHPPDRTPLARIDRLLGGLGLYQLVRPIVVGVVHGLAGSAAVALLVLPAIREPAWSLLYIALFGLGTVVGMTAVTAALAWPLAAGGSARFAGRVRVASGFLSLAFGAFLAYRVGVVEGLLL